MKLQFGFKGLIAILSFMLTVSVVHAQGPGDPGPDPDPSTAVPIDGGLTLLVVAAAGYAGKKAYNKRKRENEINFKNK